MGDTAAHTRIIVNELAGGGAMADGFRRVEHRLRDGLGDFDVAFTDYSGHARVLAAQAFGEGVGRVIAAGGDGTLHEVVNGYFGDDGAPIHPEAVVGVLNGGTGGDLRRALRIGDLDHAVATVVGGRTRRLDVGRVVFSTEDGGEGVRYFINIASFGLSGEVDRHLDAFRRVGGSLAYVAATLRGMWGYRNPRVALTIGDDFEAELPISTVAVGNGRYFGGGMMVCPDAQLDDGLFDVTILGDLGKIELLRLTRHIYTGAHIYEPKVITRQAPTVRATALGRAPVFLDIDGEAVGRLPARFELLPSAIRFAAP